MDKIIGLVNRVLNIKPVSPIEKLDQERQREEAKAAELRKILEAKQKLAKSATVVAQLKSSIADTDSEIAETRGAKQAKSATKTSQQPQFSKLNRH
jgi:CRISPR/Cas system-associated endonuclease Cas3-HD